MSVAVCPNCKAQLESKTTICEWCGYVLDRNGSDSIEEIKSRLTHLIIEGKNLPQPGVWSSIWRNSRISMIVFAIASFLIASKGNDLFYFVGAFFLVLAFFSIFKGKRNLSADKKRLEAEYVAEIQNIQNLYGSNNEIAKQIQEIKNEWKKIDQNFSKSKLFEWFAYAIILAVLLFAYFMPESKTKDQLQNEQTESESQIVTNAQRAVENDSLDVAIQLLGLVNSNASKIKISSMIQLRECFNQIKESEQMIIRSQYDSAKNKLMNLRWEKGASDYDAELIEEPYFIDFVKYKNNAVKKLPAQFSIPEEDEFNY